MLTTPHISKESTNSLVITDNSATSIVYEIVNLDVNYRWGIFKTTNTVFRIPQNTFDKQSNPKIDNRQNF